MVLVWQVDLQTRMREQLIWPTAVPQYCPAVTLHYLTPNRLDSTFLVRFKYLMGALGGPWVQ